MKFKMKYMIILLAVLLSAVAVFLMLIPRGGAKQTTQTTQTTETTQTTQTTVEPVFPDAENCSHFYGEDGVCKYCFLISEDLLHMNGGICFDKSTVLPEKVRIPDRWRGMPVTSIGNDAFYNQKNLRAVYIPEGVKQIGLNAFSLCTALEEVRMPESLEKIGKGAFYGCESLASLYIPAGVKYINPGAFMSQSAGFRLDVDENNTEYHWAGNCLISTWKKTLVYGNETSVIPDDGSVETIGMYAFMYSKHLTEIDIPASVTKIEDEAFSTCTSLETVTVRGAKIIKRCAFQGCTGLKKVSLPDTLTTLGGNAFENCRALKQVSIPAGVRQVESCAFQGCTALWQVKLDEGLRSIEERAFRGCIALAEIEIPDTVTVLGAGAFSGCSSLEKVILSAKLTRVEESTFYGCSSLVRVSLPEGVTYVGRDAFSNCASLAEIDIPVTVKKIERGALDHCEVLNRINFDGTVGQWRLSIGLTSYDIFGACTVYCTDGEEHLWE